MYRILLESSNRDLAVGLAKDGVILDKICYYAWQRQSETMVNEVDTLLTKYGVSRNDISDVVVSIGPGSYTGVRVALTIAKVISLAISCPIYAVSALAILKNGDSPSICLINARSNRSYVGVYKGKEIIVKDTIWTNEEVLSYIKENPSFVLCGDLSYLGLEGYTSDTIKEMLSLVDESTLVKDTLGLTPVYLKD